jgi:hypothetical protein
MSATTDSSTILRLALPSDLLTHFEAQAFLADQPVEELIVAHLQRTRDYTSSAPIYLDDAAAKLIRRHLGARINTPEKLVDMIVRLSSMKVAGTKIDVSPARQEAMVWWAKSMQLSLEDALPKLFDQALGGLLKC